MNQERSSIVATGPPGHCGGSVVEIVVVDGRAGASVLWRRGTLQELRGVTIARFAAFVMDEDAEFLRTVIRQYGLDIVSPQDFQGLVGRYSWLSLGRIPVGRYDLVHPIPAVDKQVVRLKTRLGSNCVPSMRAMRRSSAPSRHSLHRRMAV
jgi:hypothetical protein